MREYGWLLWRFVSYFRDCWLMNGEIKHEVSLFVWSACARAGCARAGCARAGCARAGCARAGWGGRWTWWALDLVGCRAGRTVLLLR
jgi:hypothetical protein